MYEFVDENVALTINMLQLARTDYVACNWKNLPVLNFSVLLPCSVALGWVKAMGCHPEDKDISPAMA